MRSSQPHDAFCKCTLRFKKPLVKKYKRTFQGIQCSPRATQKNMSSRRPEPKLHFAGDKSFQDATHPDVYKLFHAEQYEQRTAEWLAKRMTLISASDVGTALLQTPEVCGYYIESFGHLPGFNFKPKPKSSCNPYSSQAELLEKKCNVGEPFEGNPATKHGQKFENVSANVYSQLRQVDLLEFGLLIHPEHSFLGASPDGITTDRIMLEIKNPITRAVAWYPSLMYFLQILLQLECTGLSECDFMDCSFAEYPDASDWHIEADEWEALNADAKHHLFGIILSYTGPDGEDKHLYPSPLVRTKAEFIAWMEETLRSQEHSGLALRPTYYKLADYRICRVRRNPQWFQTNLPAMRNMWDRILSGRTEEGTKAVLDAQAKRKRGPRPPRGPVVAAPLNEKYKTCLV